MFVEILMGHVARIDAVEFVNGLGKGRIVAEIFDLGFLQTL